jgi:hypothetical protein
MHMEIQIHAWQSHRIASARNIYLRQCSYLGTNSEGQSGPMVIDRREHEFDPTSCTWQLQYPPHLILFKPDETRAASLSGLLEGVFPIEPVTCNYKVNVQGIVTVIER